MIVFIFFILLLLTIQIINIIGYVNITNFAFNNSSDEHSRSINLTSTQMTFIRISVILQIITVLGVFSYYVDGFRNKENKVSTFTILLYILYAIGLSFIAKFSFASRNNGDERTVELTDTEIIFVKITAIMQWASVIFISIFLITSLYLISSI
jgi:hypothetical protein